MDYNEEQDRQRVSDRFQELYEQKPALRVVCANDEGDLELLEETFFIKKELDILGVTPDEKWNWLHRCNLYAPAPLAVMEFYIQHGVPVNAQDMYGMTPLHYALRAHNADAAIALLNAGADPNIPNRDNLRPLSMAGYLHNQPLENLEKVLELMLQKGGNVHNILNENETILEGWAKRGENASDWEKAIYRLMKQYA